MSDETPQPPPDDAGQPVGGGPPPPQPATPPLPDTYVSQAASGYPVTFDFTGPEQLSRLSTFFRIILLIPLFIFLSVLTGGLTIPRGGNGENAALAGGGVFGGLVLAYWLSILVRGGRPVGWIGGVIVAIQRFQIRAYTYFLLLTDKYPAFEGDWFAQYEAERPEKISRKQIFFWKTIASIPHFLVLAVLGFAVAFCEVVAWFAIIFTGHFPRGLREFVVGWLRWSARVTAYWISLRDEFPPYSLDANARSASRATAAWSAFGGVAIIAIIGAAIVGVVVGLGGSESQHVPYADLLENHGGQTIVVSKLSVSLPSAEDPYTFPDRLLTPNQGSRFVQFTASLTNSRTTSLDVYADDFELVDSKGDSHRPSFISVGGEVPPKSVGDGGLAGIVLIFEVPNDARPTKLQYDPSGALKRAEFIFD